MHDTAPTYNSRSHVYTSVLLNIIISLSGVAMYRVTVCYRTVIVILTAMASRRYFETSRAGMITW